MDAKCRVFLCSYIDQNVTRTHHWLLGSISIQLRVNPALRSACRSIEGVLSMCRLSYLWLHQQCHQTECRCLRNCCELIQLNVLPMYLFLFDMFLNYYNYIGLLLSCNFVCVSNYNFVSYIRHNIDE